MEFRPNILKVFVDKSANLQNVTTMTGSMSDKTTLQAKMSETEGQLAGKLRISKLY